MPVTSAEKKADCARIRLCKWPRNNTWTRKAICRIRLLARICSQVPTRFWCHSAPTRKLHGMLPKTRFFRREKWCQKCRENSEQADTQATLLADLPSSSRWHSTRPKTAMAVVIYGRLRALNHRAFDSSGTVRRLYDNLKDSGTRRTCERNGILLCECARQRSAQVIISEITLSPYLPSEGKENLTSLAIRKSCSAGPHHGRPWHPHSKLATRDFDSVSPGPDIVLCCLLYKACIRGKYSVCQVWITYGLSIWRLTMLMTTNQLIK